jgi:2-polyprenyl-3-methyl-5-hydroxy-6-metoxy-1,4-benzoquinol methylase
MDFSTRSYQKEWLDRDDIPFDAIKRNMRELDLINGWLGGHRITLSGLKEFIKDQKKITICEVGCGGGDNLAAIGKWCEKNRIDAAFTGIDINPHCIAVAKSRFKGSNSRFIASDFRSVQFENEKCDVLFSSLFCHHFSDEELISMFHWMQENSRLGFFINDLHRHPLAYHSIAILTKLFSRSWLVKHDAPVSVSRGFIRSEWESLLEQAGIRPDLVQWKWAFRWLIIVKNRA